LQRIGCGAAPKWPDCAYDETTVIAAIKGLRPVRMAGPEPAQLARRRHLRMNPVPAAGWNGDIHELIAQLIVSTLNPHHEVFHDKEH